MTPDADDIIKATATFYEIEPQDLTGDSNLRKHAWPRQVCYRALHESQTADGKRRSKSEVGRIFKRDHTTIMHGIKAAEARRTDGAVQDILHMARSRFAARMPVFRTRRLSAEFMRTAA